MKSVEQLLKDASAHFAKLNICPDEDDLLGFVVEKLEDHAGTTFTAEQIEKVKAECFGSDKEDENEGMSV